MNRTISFVSWNVRGLGQSSRCDDVLAELLSVRPSIVALQETKLPTVSNQKRNSFLPARLSNFVTRDSVGASGGMLTAWDASVFSLENASPLPYTLTSGLSLRADSVSFSLTNVYAPTSRENKPAFFRELASIADSISSPWMLLGDFNLTRFPDDKNTDSFNVADADRFNEVINALGLIEIPLVDRAYTWSNRRDEPTLVRLDRCFVSLD